MKHKNLEALRDRAYEQGGTNGFTVGEQYLLENYDRGLKTKTDKLSIKEMPWRLEDLDSFIEALNDYEINEFVLTDRVEMKILAKLDEVGWKMNGMDKVKYTDYYHGELKEMILDGINLIKR